MKLFNIDEYKLSFDDRLDYIKKVKDIVNQMKGDGIIQDNFINVVSS